MTTRAQAAARLNGSAVAKKGSTQGSTTVRPKTISADTLSSQVKIGFSNSPIARSLGSFLINDPPPIYRPYVMPGLPSKEHVTASVGILRAIPSSDPNPTYDDGTGNPINFPALNNRHWAFRFHWNPASIAYNTPADYNQSARPQIDIGRQLFINNGSISFQTMIERQDEVAQRTPTTFTVMGSDNFADLGTMYDIEFLYRAVNGDPQARQGHPYQTSNFGFLYAYPVNVKFNNVLDFDGIVTSIDVDHQQFTPNMIPTVSFITVTMTLINEVAPMGTDITTKSSTSQAVGDSVGTLIQNLGLTANQIKALNKFGLLGKVLAANSTPTNGS